MLVHELAARSGLSPHTVRHYVRIGLLRASKERWNGYHHFGEESVLLLEIIAVGKALGFSLAELKAQLAPFHDGAMRFEDIRQALLDKEAEVDRRIQELQEMRQGLRRLIQHCPLSDTLAPAGALNVKTSGSATWS